MTYLHFVFSLGRPSCPRRSRLVLLQQRANHCRARYRKAAYVLRGRSSSKHFRNKIRLSNAALAIWSKRFGNWGECRHRTAPF